LGIPVLMAVKGGGERFHSSRRTKLLRKKGKIVRIISPQGNSCINLKEGGKTSKPTKEGKTWESSTERNELQLLAGEQTTNGKAEGGYQWGGPGISREKTILRNLLSSRIRRFTVPPLHCDNHAERAYPDLRHDRRGVCF